MEQERNITDLHMPALQPLLLTYPHMPLTCPYPDPVPALTCILRLQLAHEDYYLVYAPPEYCNSMTSDTLRSLGPKGDVYSFGVVSCCLT